jgi:hypothetical protein
MIHNVGRLGKFIIHFDGYFQQQKKKLYTGIYIFISHKQK